MDATVSLLCDRAHLIARSTDDSEAALLANLRDAMLGRRTTVVVDLADTPMLSATMLTALRRLGASLRARGGSLTVRASHPGLVRLLDMTLLSSSFTLEATAARMPTPAA